VVVTVTGVAPVRILLTGSRSLPFRLRSWLADELHALADEYGADDRGLLLVHGQCNPRRGKRWEQWHKSSPRDSGLSGADWHGNWIAVEAGWRVEPHPADWHGLGVQAGPVRNRAMAQAGAAVCLAVRVVGVPCAGTDNCAAEARRAGIKVVDRWGR
jgi:hypothetical protein